MDFTALSIVGKEKLNLKPLTSARNHAVHNLIPQADDLQLLMFDKVDWLYSLVFKVPDVLQASLARGGTLYTQPHEVMLYAFLLPDERLVFVSSVNPNYVKAISEYLAKQLTVHLEPVRIQGRALMDLVHRATVAFYGAEIQSPDGDRTVVQRRSDFTGMADNIQDQLASITITPKVDSANMFMLTVKAKGTFHANCDTLPELLKVFRLVAEAVHA